MGIYDNVLQSLREAEGSSEYEQMLSVLRDSLGEPVEAFCTARKHVMDIATRPTQDLKDLTGSEPPFVLDDGESYFAVVLANGEVRPLPFGFELHEEDLVPNDDSPIMSTPASSTSSGLIRYIPVREDIALPCDGDFELERLVGTDEVTDEAALESIKVLKAQLMAQAESEEAQIAMASLIEQGEAIAEGDVTDFEEILQELVEGGEEARIELQEFIDAMALADAAIGGDVREVRRLLQQGVDQAFGTPAYAYAILSDQPDVFEVFVESGVDVTEPFDWTNEDESTTTDINALILAVATGYRWALVRLLELGIDPNYETPRRETALLIAIAQDQLESVDFLLDKLGDFPISLYDNALVNAAHRGLADVVSRLLSLGVHVDSTNSSGWSALKRATVEGHQDVAALLLEHGADANMADEEDWTPLLNAVENRDLDMVRLLLSKGADPNAAPDIVAEEDQKGFSALMRAAHYGELEIVESLIAAGADLAQADSDGVTAINYAALHRHPDCLRLLLRHGADPNCIGSEGYASIGWFLVGLVNSLAEETSVDETAAIAILDLLLEADGDWKGAAEKLVSDVGEPEITLVAAVAFAVNELGLEDLGTMISQLQEGVAPAVTDRKMVSNGQAAASRSQLLQDLELSDEQYQALAEDVREFCETRSQILESAMEQPDLLETISSEGTGVGEPPYVIDDGESIFAILREDGSVSPLPYAFELLDDDLNIPDDAELFSTLGPTSSGVIRFIPVSNALSIPDADAFALEQQLANEMAKFDFEGLIAEDDIYFDAQSGEPFTGHAKLRWPDGSLRKEAEFVNGMNENKMTWWYENGQKELEDCYVENMRHGTHRAWHDNGQLMAQGESVHGQRQGVWRWWHDNGKLAEESEYIDDEPQKKSTYWYGGGTKKLVTSYLDGLEHGTQKTWFENGQRNTELDMQNGVPHGLLTVWYESGVKAGEMHLTDGQKHGVEKRWDEAGELIEQVSWLHGEEAD